MPNKSGRCLNVRLTSASEREKLKIINTLTNQSNQSQVQPIRKVENGKASLAYLFSDDDIIQELENHHIRKDPHSAAGSSNTQISANMEQYNYSSHTMDMLMDAEISDHEVTLLLEKKQTW